MSFHQRKNVCFWKVAVFPYRVLLNLWEGITSCRVRTSIAPVVPTSCRGCAPGFFPGTSGTFWPPGTSGTYASDLEPLGVGCFCQIASRDFGEVARLSPLEGQIAVPGFHHLQGYLSPSSQRSFLFSGCAQTACGLSWHCMTGVSGRVSREGLEGV